MRQARVQYLTFGPSDDIDALYGWINTSEAGTIMCLANGENHSDFMLRTGKHAGDDGVEMQMQNGDLELILRPGRVVAHDDVESPSGERAGALATFGVVDHIASAGLFGAGKEPAVLLRAMPEGGVVQCKAPGDLSSVIVHARNHSPMVILSDEKGKDIVQLQATKTGGIAMIHGGDERKPVITMGAGDDGSSIELRSFDRESRVSLQAREKTSDLFVRRPGRNGDGIFIRNTADGSTLNLVHEGKSLAHLGHRWIGMDMIISPAAGGGKISSGPIAFGGALHLSTTDNRMLTFSPVEVESQIASLSPEGLMQFQIGAPFDAGGRLILYNEVGVERLCFFTQKDSAMIQLQHGGTPGITLAATPEGGGLCTLDPEGGVTGAVPAEFDFGGFGKEEGDEPK